MIETSGGKQSSAFSWWLRTGKVPAALSPDGLELKFNPWHDSTDGRFTFAGSGQNYGKSGSGGFRDGRGGSGGGGGASSHEAWPRGSGSAGNRQGPRPASTPKEKAPPARASSPKTSVQRPTSQNGWGGGGFTGGGGGSFGGAGASGYWGIDPRKQPTVSTASGTANRQSPSQTTATSQHSAAATPLRREVRNGYQYQIDETGRTRRVFGTLTLADKQVRSRTAQAQAGGADRRPVDDGGHYIAARFDGPTDAFNHFAQDANFNRGDYRSLEDQWAMAKRRGKNVTVTIMPSYTAGSKRPAVIDVSFTINGLKQSVKFANEPKEKRRGK